jgi:hypothetical protein
MRKCLAVLLVAALLPAHRAFSEEHLLAPVAAQARLREAAAARARDLAVVDQVLATPEAAAAAARLGADMGRLRAAVPSLSDAEVRDLASRAAALRTDPVAGLDSDIRQLLVIFLIVAIVILVLQAVD